MRIYRLIEVKRSTALIMKSITLGHTPLPLVRLRTRITEGLLA